MGETEEVRGHFSVSFFFRGVPFNYDIAKRDITRIKTTFITEMDKYKTLAGIFVYLNSSVFGGVSMQVNILEAKTNLSNLVRLIETGKEERIIIARYGKPVVKMVLYNDVPVSKRIGVAKGKLKSPEDLDQYNDEIAGMFGGAL